MSQNTTAMQRGAGGETTGATDMTTQQPEALRLANVCSNLTRYSMDAHLIAAELRRQHARITELESQLAQRFDAADVATASAQGFRDGAASVDVAQERPTPEHIEAMQRAWLWMENQAEAQSKGGHATFDLMMLRDERDALRAAIDSYPPPALEGWKPTSEMRAVVAVAVTMLYDTHPEDVLRVFDLCELEKISSITMLLGSQQVEDIYRRAWDHLTAPPLASEAKEPK